MKQRLQRPIALLALAVGLALLGLIAGRSALAQNTAPASGERQEESAGKTGRIENLTPDQLPALQPENLNTIYHFAGGLNNTVSAVNRATVVQCTNVHESDSTEIELQLFQYNATSVYTGTVTVDPLDTATFESSSVEFYAADVVMGAGFVEQGLGRILAEHDQLICTVQTVDPDNIPPTWGFNIPVYIGPFSQAMLPAVLRSGTP